MLCMMLMNRGREAKETGRVETRCAACFLDIRPVFGGVDGLDRELEFERDTNHAWLGR